MINESLIKGEPNTGFETGEKGPFCCGNCSYYKDGCTQKDMIKYSKQPKLSNGNIKVDKDDCCEYVDRKGKDLDESNYGAAIFFVNPETGNALFLKRADGNWDIPGGLVKQNETDDDAAHREAFEEIGSYPDGDKKFHMNTHMLHPNGKVTSFSIFRQEVPKEFVPSLNDKHLEHVWKHPSNAPEPLLHGTRQVITKKG